LRGLQKNNDIVKLLNHLKMNASAQIIEFIKNGENVQLEKMLDENPELASGKTDQGISFLQFACYCRNTDAVSLFKKHKSSLGFFEAASTGDVEAIKQQLKEDPALLNSFSPDGFTALGLASFFGNQEIVKFLLENNADPNVASANSFHVAPIHSACAISNFEIAELLIKSGADVNAKQMSGVTPLHSAAHNGQTKIAKLLIENGAEVNTKTEDGKSPLEMAEEKGFEETAAFIRQYTDK
jgi:ankyrin repeat protein